MKIDPEFVEDLVPDEWALRRLAYLYARGVDATEPHLIAAIFTDDAVVRTKFKTWSGAAELRQMCLDLPKAFPATMHIVHNQVVQIDGAQAQGETYATSFHIMHAPRGAPLLYEAGLKYQDSWRKDDGVWRFTYRDIVMIWNKVTQVESDFSRV